MLSILFAIIGIIITILLVVGVHEFGHFIVARWTGVKVLRFSIGFGKPLYRWHDKKGTEYVIAAIPLGGYVKLLDEMEDDVPPAEKHLAFNHQPFYKKFLIVAAGPTFNVIFAFLIYWSLFMMGFTNIIPLMGKITPHSIAAQAGMQPEQEIVRVDDRHTTSWMSVIIGLLERAGDKGQLLIETKNPYKQTLRTYSLDLNDWHMNDLKPDPLESLGITVFEPHIPAIVGKITPASPAANALQPKDTILAIDNKPIQNWQDMMKMVGQHPDTVLVFKIKRAGKIINTKIKIGFEKDLFFKKHGYLGISSDYRLPENLLRRHKYAPIPALSKIVMGPPKLDRETLPVNNFPNTMKLR